MASATENSSSATVSSEPVSAAKAASACRSTSAKEVEEVPRITGPYRVAAWDDSRSSRKRSITRRERSSSLSDSPTIFEARSLARSPTSPRSWVEAASRSASSCCRPEASTRSDSASARALARGQHTLGFGLGACLGLLHDALSVLARLVADGRGFLSCRGQLLLLVGLELVGL